MEKWKRRNAAKTNLGQEQYQPLRYLGYKRVNTLELLCLKVCIPTTLMLTILFDVFLDDMVQTFKRY